MTNPNSQNDQENKSAEIIKKLKKVQQDLEFTGNQLSRKIGISSTALSQVLNDAYKYDENNHVWYMIENFLDKVNSDVFETELIRKINRLLDQSFLEKKIGVLASCSGAGKTTAIERYCFKKQEAVIIRVTEVFNVKYMLQKMLQSVNVPYIGLSKQGMFESLSEILHKKQRLFIIDEAERLHTSELETLRDVYDQGNIGLVLVGLPVLTKILKEGHDRKQDLVQLYSRAAFIEVMNVLSEKDVKLVFDKTAPGHQLEGRHFEKLAEECAQTGGLRAIINLANYSAQIARKDNKKVNEKILLDAVYKIAI